MKTRTLVFVLLATTFASAPLIGLCANKAEGPQRGSAQYSPYVENKYPKRIYWGDTHLHSSYSTDAGMIGNRLGPEEAYKFARGEEVVASGGVRAKLSRPLDFLVVADHAENLGLAPMIAESNKDLLKSEFGKHISSLVKEGKFFKAYSYWGKSMLKAEDPLPNEALQRSMWERITTAAEAYNEPGRFTALIGFEWTSSLNASNLHRNVIFRDGKDKTDRVLPYSNYDSSDPEDLWRYLAAYEEEVGGKVLAIPHNGNLSNGLMFDVEKFSNGPIDRDYAERRQRWEPLYEVTQIKGDGEAHPSLSPNDEFADYGTWDRGSFGVAKEPEMIPREYAREALKRGLALEKELGANPFKFGMLGSTDSHTSLATAEEDNFFGKVSVVEPCEEPSRFAAKITGHLPDPKGRDYTIRHYQAIASGLAAVWATENTREALWDALQRKEVYATTGTRVALRVFGGWDFTAENLYSHDFAEVGYDGGVPMGGDLSSAPEKKAPALMVRALRDPDGANLDRLQVVKGWLDSDGELKERVYDAAVSDGRKIGEDGRCKTPVGNTVEVSKATYSNSIGSPELTALWRDPDFDPAECAFYYVRVLEIPTPRWTTYDAAHFGVELPKDIDPAHQERAYSSPIWYAPSK